LHVTWTDTFHHHRGLAALALFALVVTAVVGALLTLDVWDGTTTSPSRPAAVEHAPLAEEPLVLRFGDPASTSRVGHVAENEPLRVRYGS
jgi:hypothetical protein